MSEIKRYLILKNEKILCYASSKEEALAIIARRKVRKVDNYALRDLEKEVQFRLELCTSQQGNREKSYPKTNSFVKPKIRRFDVVDENYSNWLATQPCVITGEIAGRGCGAYDMHCHHIHGRGRRRNDYMQVPLMGYVHSWGEKSYHSCDKKSFIAYWGLPIADIIEFFEFHAWRLKSIFSKNF